METTSSEKCNNCYTYVAFFDLDRTLTRKISGKELVRLAVRRKLMTAGDLFYAAYLSLIHRLGLRDPFLIVSDMTSWVKGMEEETLNGLCSEVACKVLLPSVFPSAISEIKHHRERGAMLVLLSSALRPVCSEIASGLAFDDILCSELESSGGRLTGKTVGPLCYGEEKMHRLREFCLSHSQNPSDAWYYGDSVSDLAVLSSVGNPICINPERALKKKAKRRGWKVLSWKR